MRRVPWRPPGDCSVSPAARLCLRMRDAPLPLRLSECEARRGAAEAEREEGEVRRGRREEGGGRARAGRLRAPHLEVGARPLSGSPRAPIAFRRGLSCCFKL